MKITEKACWWAAQKGNTKQKLADELGVTANTITSRLNGETEWTWSEACKLAKLLKCSLDEFAD